jgi:hypothetical protein
VAQVTTTSPTKHHIVRGSPLGGRGHLTPLLPRLMGLLAPDAARGVRCRKRKSLPWPRPEGGAPLRHNQARGHECS